MLRRTNVKGHSRRMFDRGLRMNINFELGRSVRRCVAIVWSQNNSRKCQDTGNGSRGKQLSFGKHSYQG